jgi:hypothetical protein
MQGWSPLQTVALGWSFEMLPSKELALLRLTKSLKLHRLRDEIRLKPYDKQRSRPPYRLFPASGIFG